MMDDIYYEMRNLRRVDESLRGWYPFVEGGGNVQKTSTTFTPRYLTFLTDPRPITTKIVPAGNPSVIDVSHTLVVKGEGITDLGTAGATCFDKSLLNVSVDIEFEPPGAEIIRLDQELIEYASFAGYIHVKPSSTISGTGYYNDVPIGTPLAPVNNWVDAHFISEDRGIPGFLIYETTTIAGVDFSAGHNFIGISPFVVVTLDSSSNFTTCNFQNMTLLGDLDGINTVRDCSIGPITGASGFFEKCAFWGSVALTGDTSVFECYSQVVGNGTAEFIVGEWDLIIRDFAGSVEISGSSLNHISSIGVKEGRITVAADCTEGEFHLRGEPYQINDLTSGNAVVIDETTSEKLREIHQIHGLDAAVPMTVTPTSRAAGSLSQTISGDGDTSTTVTRD